MPEITTRIWTTGRPSIKGKVERAYLVLKNGTHGDEVTITEVVNGIQGASIVEKIVNPALGILYPAVYPVSFTRYTGDNPITFNFSGIGKQGWTFQFIIEWPGTATLLSFEAEITELTPEGGLQQQASPYNQS